MVSSSGFRYRRSSVSCLLGKNATSGTESLAFSTRPGHYSTYPPLEDVDGSEVLLEGLIALNPAAAIVTKNYVVDMIFQRAPEGRRTVPLSDGVNVQILNGLEDLHSAKRYRTLRLDYLSSVLIGVHSNCRTSCTNQE